MDNSTKVTSFSPIISEEATVLILGSMPGQESLRQQQYYAFSRNAFWYIMDHICGAAPERKYSERVRRLQEAGIAVWDVLQHCEREGSLDSNIKLNTEVPNDFTTFLREYENIRCILFNGQKAEKAFRRHVLDTLPDEIRKRIALYTLPSTSPAYTISKVKKLRQWREHMAKCSVAIASS